MSTLSVTNPGSNYRTASSYSKSEERAANYAAANTRDSSESQPPSESGWGFFKPYVRPIPNVPAAPRTEKPVIGILVQEQPSESSGSGGSIHTTGGRTQMYAAAVRDQGGVAHFIWDDGRPTSELLKGVHGLLIPGGADLNPVMYGQDEEPGSRLSTTPLKFDEWERDIVKTAIGANVPTRGICRGHQLLNVLFPKGTLQQDIGSTQSRTRPYPYTVSHTSGTHAVAVMPGTTLSDITSSEAFMANSYHHQAVGDVGEGLRVNARSADGTIEGIENHDGSIMGVQFHPERDSGKLKTQFFTDFITRANNWRGEHDPLSAAELADLMTKAASSHQTVRADGEGATRHQALAMGLASLDKQGYEMVHFGGGYGDNLVTDRNIDSVSGTCEVRGRKTHRVVISAAREQRDEFLLSLTDEGVAHLPKDAQDVLALAQQARDTLGGKTGDLFRRGYSDSIPNPIQVVWAFRRDELTFTPPRDPSTRIHSVEDLQQCIAKARPSLDWR